MVVGSQKEARPPVHAIGRLRRGKFADGASRASATAVRLRPKKASMSLCTIHAARARASPRSPAPYTPVCFFMMLFMLLRSVFFESNMHNGTLTCARSDYTYEESARPSFRTCHLRARRPPARERTLGHRGRCEFRRTDEYPPSYLAWRSESGDAEPEPCCLHHGLGWNLFQQGETINDILQRDPDSELICDPQSFPYRRGPDLTCYMCMFCSRCEAMGDDCECGIDTEGFFFTSAGGPTARSPMWKVRPVMRATVTLWKVMGGVAVELEGRLRGVVVW
jgi:hypothetical protein